MGMRIVLNCCGYMGNPTGKVYPSGYGYGEIFVPVTDIGILMDREERDTGDTERRLLTGCRLEEGVFLSYNALQPGEENSVRFVISLLTWLCLDDVDPLFAGLQLIIILALRDTCVILSDDKDVTVIKKVIK
uniref:Uncharacterized protein n=1 Tax=Oryza brachyantha TaxID=4533 RepID=J3NBW1_ORYBR